MQPVDEIYERLLLSNEYYVETSVIIGLDGVLINEEADRILFGGDAIIVQTNKPDTGYRENMLINVNTTKRVFKNNIPEVGCCPSGEIYIEMHMPRTNFSRKAEIIPYIRLVSEKDENDHSDWLQKGLYYIDTRDNSHNDDNLDILNIHGYDSLIKANQEYGEYFEEVDFEITSQDETLSTVPHWTKANNVWTAMVTDSKVKNKEITVEYTGDESIAFKSNVTFQHDTGNNYVDFTASSAPPPNLFGKFVIRKPGNTLSFPADVVSVVLDIGEKMGVNVETESIDFMCQQMNVPFTGDLEALAPYKDRMYQIEYPSEYTMIEVLGYIGAMFGGNWIMNDLDELKLIPLWALPKETNLIVNEYGYRITFGTGTKMTRIKTFKY